MQNLENRGDFLTGNFSADSNSDNGITTTGSYEKDFRIFGFRRPIFKVPVFSKIIITGFYFSI